MSSCPISKATLSPGFALQKQSSSGKQISIIDLAYNDNLNVAALKDSTDTISVFIHGLDSSSHTWRNVLTAMAPSSMAFAVDLRGNGGSTLGDPKEFSVNSIVQDLHHFLQITIPSKISKDGEDVVMPNIVLIGHSMGARVASCYAAKYPSMIKALIMEDMDIRPRKMETNPVPMDYEKIRNFGKKFDSQETTMNALQECGYPLSMVNKWVTDGRIREIQGDEDDTNDSYYWTDVNPEMRWLAYKHIMCTSEGAEALKTIASCEDSFPCHVLASGIESQCEEESLRSMKEIMEERMILHRFPSATHSIHRTAAEDFMRLLHQIVKSPDGRV